MIVSTPGGRVSVKGDPVDRAHFGGRASPGAGLAELIGPSLFATYAGLYRTQPWLAVAVNKYKDAVARLPLHTIQRGDGQDRERTRSHPVARLMDNPNPAMSSFTWKEWMGGDMKLYGNHVSVAVGEPGQFPSEIWPIPWPKVEVQGQRQPELYLYHADIGGKPIPFLPEQVLHLRRWSSVSHTDPLVGTSPVEPLRRTLMNEDASQKWISALFKNAARPSGVATTSQKLNREQVKIVREELEQIYGGVDNAFRVAVMQGGLSWEPVAFTAVESELINLRKLQREEVAAALDVPPPIMHILDRATFSNITEQRIMWYQESVGVETAFIEAELYSQLIQPYFPDVFVEFDFGDVLRPTAKERAEAYSMFRRIYTLDELRARENLPPIGGEVGSAVWVPINEMPVSPGGSLPTQEERSAPLMVLMSSLDRVEQYAASRIGAGKNGFDPSRFARELCADLRREDDAVKVWAASVASAVDETIHGSKTPADLHERMAALRASLQEPV